MPTPFSELVLLVKPLGDVSSPFEEFPVDVSSPVEDVIALFSLPELGEAHLSRQFFPLQVCHSLWSPSVCL